MNRNEPKRARGCGCALGLIVVAMVVAICVVGYLITSAHPSVTSNRKPVPDTIPPPRGIAAPAVDTSAPGRTSLQFHDWAKPISEKTGISVEALSAYANADVIARHSRPQCHLDWTTLAGIGWVETRHGTYNGKKFGASHINSDGVATPPIIGVPLDGSPGVADLSDTDHGELDGDKEKDRAVGPMQFIPAAWKLYGIDASGDGKADPNNIDDAAAAAMRLLCAFDRDLSTEKGWKSAIFSYNQSDQYREDVRVAAANYALEQKPAGA